MKETLIFLLVGFAFVSAAPLDAPRLLSPKNGEKTILPFPHFVWEKNEGTLDIKDPLAYEVEIASDSQFSRRVKQDRIYLARYVPNKPLPPGNYFWRVRASRGGKTGNFSSGSFVVTACDETIQIKKHGAGENAYPAILKALNRSLELSRSGKSVRLELEKGEYFIDAAGTNAVFAIHNATNLILDGNGSKMHMQNWGVSLGKIERSQNIVVRDFDVDWDKEMPFSQGRVRETDASSGTVTVAIDAGFPGIEAPHFMKGDSFHILMDPLIPGRMKAATPLLLWYHKDKTTTLESNTFRLTLKNPSTLKFYEKNDRIVFFARSGGGESVFGGTESENVTYYGMHSTTTAGGGHYLMIKGSVFNVIGCRQTIKQGRWFGGNADGVHVRELRVGPWIEDFYSEGLGDDSIALYARPVKIHEVTPKANELVVYADFFNWEPGNELIFFNPRKGIVFAEAVVKSIAPEGDKYRVVFDRDIRGITKTGPDKSEDDQIWNRSKSCGDFTIRHSTIKNIRRFGAVFRAQGGVIEDSHFEGCSSSGLLYINEPGYPNGPFCSDILILNNTFASNSFDTTFAYGNMGAVMRKIPYDYADGRGPRNIRIAGNTFKDWERSGVFLSGVEHAVVEKNTFVSSRTSFLFPENALVVLNRSEGILIRSNVSKDRRGAPGFRVTDTVYESVGNEFPEARETAVSKAPTTCSVEELPANLGGASGTFSKSTPRVSANASLAFKAVPETLLGKPFVTISRGNGKEPAKGYSFKIGCASTIYLFAHERGQLPDFSGWEKTDLKASWDAGGALNTDAIFKKDFPAGMVLIPENSGKNATDYAVPCLAVVVSKQ
ncbi:MAG: right-handed parallel beta-helix repeat-containing protein [Spirochaetia bacterium]|nr:right-handed parallel beta-helix repeat-containing protein [Spirochaetia bacterium]